MLWLRTDFRTEGFLKNDMRMQELNPGPLGDDPTLVPA